LKQQKFARNEMDASRHEVLLWWEKVI